MPKSREVVTIKCLCGTEWDFKSPLHLVESRIITPLPPTTATVSIGVANDLDERIKSAQLELIEGLLAEKESFSIKVGGAGETGSIHNFEAIPVEALEAKRRSLE